MFRRKVKAPIAEPAVRTVRRIQVSAPTVANTFAGITAGRFRLHAIPYDGLYLDERLANTTICTGKIRLNEADVDALIALMHAYKTLNTVR